MSDKLVLTVPEAAALLRVSTWTMYQLAKSGQVRSVRVGRLIRFREVWLTAYAEANATGPEVERGEGLWGGDGIPATGRPVGGDVGASPDRRQTPKGYADSGHGGRRMEADAGGPARRGTVELSVAAKDRRRRIVPRRLAP